MTKQKKYWNVVKSKYKDMIKAYGIYPTLYLLSEYEKEENFNECNVIYKAIKEFIKEVKDKNKTIADEINVPTHLNQITPEFSEKFKLHTLEKFINAPEYSRKIKETIKSVKNEL